MNWQIILRAIFLFAALAHTGLASAQLAKPEAAQIQRLKAQEGERIAAAARHLSQLQPKLGLSEFDSFAVRTSHMDEFGHAHVRFQQTYKNVPVLGGEMIVHLDANDAPLPITDATHRDIDLDAVPRLGSEQAITTARNELQNASTSGFSFTSRLIVYPETARVHADQETPLNAAEARAYPVRYHLAHEVRVQSAVVGERYIYVVDAVTGRVIVRWNDLHTAAAIGTGQSQFDGTVVLNTISTDQGFALVDTTRGSGGKYGGNAVTNMNHALEGDGALYTNATNTWGDSQQLAKGGDTASTNGQTQAVDAAFGLQATWDYYRNIHQRNGIDNKGAATYARVHYGNNYNNAFWDDDCFCMTYGDGNGASSLSFTSLDIAGHELTHGVTASTAALVYQGESGGLNEANSDIHGTMVEFYVRGANGTGNRIPDSGGNWLEGEQTIKPAIRYMYKPSLDHQSADAWSENLETLDVHYSSGPMNRAFYFLSQGASADSNSDYYSSYLPAGMTGIGNDSAARIWYRALTVYMTPTSNYANARQAALRAAIDLHGANSPENIAVRKAFGAINVSNPNDTSDDFEAPVVSGVNVTGGSGNVTLSAVTADNRAVVRVDYFVDGYLAGSAKSAPFSASLDSTQYANGSHRLTAQAYDAAGNMASGSVPFSLSNDTQQLLIDPGFEAGASGSAWGGFNLTTTGSIGGVQPRSGRYMSVFGGPVGVTQWRMQQIAIPAQAPHAILNFWIRIEGSANDVVRDVLTVQVRAPDALSSQPSQVLATLATYSNLDFGAKGAWVRKSFDLSAYIGQTIVVYLSGDTNNAINPTRFYLDDFSLVVSPQAPVLVRAGVDAATLTVNATRQFTATASGAGNPGVNWSILEGSVGGTVDASGLYTAPSSLGSYHVVATSVADPQASAVIGVSVTGIDGSRIALSPSPVALLAGASQQLALLSADPIQTGFISWAVLPPCTISITGLLTAAQQPGVYPIIVSTGPTTLRDVVIVRAPGAYPEAPDGLTASIQGNQVQVSWRAPAGIGLGYYYLYRDDVLRASLTASGGAAAATQYTDPSLAGGITYKYKVIACNATSNCSVASATLNVTVPGQSGPVVPIIGTATAGDGQVHVSFYVLDGGQVNVDYTATCGSITSSSQTSPIAVYGLMNDVPVSCFVTARNPVGASATSTESNRVVPRRLTPAKRGFQRSLLLQSSSGDLLAGQYNGSQFAFSPLTAKTSTGEVLNIADLSGKGTYDLVLQDGSSANPTADVTIWPGEQASSQFVLGHVKRVWEIQAVGDLDGDGFGDLVWRYTVPDSPDSGVSYIWFTDGTGIINIKKRGGAPLNWKLVGALDINGDGADDMLYLSPDNQLHVLMATDSRTCANFAAGKLPQGFSALKFADFTNTGQGDVLLRNASTGAVKMLSFAAQDLVLPPPSAAPDDINAGCTPSSTAISTTVIDLPGIDPSWQFFAAIDYFDNGYNTQIVWRQPDGTLTVWMLTRSGKVTVIADAGKAPNGYTVVQP